MIKYSDKVELHIVRFMATWGIAIATLFALPLSSATAASALNAGDFEDSAFILPSATRLTWDSGAYGKWAVGDPMSVVGVTSGITPLDGLRMMSFVPSTGQTSDVYQIVDVTGYANEIDAGLLKANLSVFFNSTASDTVGLTLFRYSAPPTSFSGSGISLLAGDIDIFTTDSDKSTWQRLSVGGVTLTRGTRFLLFGVHQAMNSNQTFADSATLLLTSPIPEPGTLGLFLAAGIFVVGFQYRVHTNNKSR